MRIFYGYSNCTDSTYNRIVSERNVSTMMPDQKYHGLLIKGLAENDAEVRCFSGLPINRLVTSRKLICEKDEQEGNAYFHYITTINLPILRQLMIFFGTFFGVLREKKDKDTYAICDCLNFANAYGLIFGAMIKRIKTMLIVTDLPNVQTSERFRPWLNSRIFKLADSYLFLTEQMNSKLNREKKPYIVLEGHVDAAININEIVFYSSTKKIVMYAGSIHEIYGIKNLTSGFLLAGIPDCELHIYGDGDYREELIRLSREFPCIKYMGTKSNDVIVSKEREATVLVNPRPTRQEFTPYSFPSKTLEYMVSGTPVLTTKLPGIPSEYFDYLYAFQNETPRGIAETLKGFFEIPEYVRNQRAEKGRRFVLQKKSNITQAKKIIQFLQGL